MKSAAAVTQERSLSVRLPETAAGDAVLALRRSTGSEVLTVDASELRFFDATLVATLASWRLETMTDGSRFNLLLPTDPSTRRRLRQALGSEADPRCLSVLPAMPVSSNRDVKRAAAITGARLGGRVADSLANVAMLVVVALTDNALTHAPNHCAAAAARLSEQELTVCVRDRGHEALSPDVARFELVERIQLPLSRESCHENDGFGIAWIQHLIERDSLEAELLFASGSGRLHVRARSVFCEASQPVEGFTAAARFAL
jgi:hypothetical protein